MVAHNGKSSCGVRDHAAGLASHISSLGVPADVRLVEWRRDGFFKSLRKLRHQLRQAQSDCVLLHYSHLAWSRRGLPFGFLVVFGVCRSVTSTTVWVHDPSRIGGRSLKHRAATFVKGAALRLAYRCGRGIVVSVEPTAVYWLGKRSDDVAFVPSTGPLGRHDWAPVSGPFTLACFAQTQYSNDADKLLFAVAVGLRDRIGPFKLRLLGAGAVDPSFEDRLRKAGIELECPGYLERDALAEALRTSHAFLMTRAPLSSRNSSVAAALACGLPVTGNFGPETSEQLRQAALRAVCAEPGSFIDQLIALARDEELAHEHSKRSHALYDDVYDWRIVAPRVLALLELV